MASGLGDKSTDTLMVITCVPALGSKRLNPLGVGNLTTPNLSEFQLVSVVDRAQWITGQGRADFSILNDYPSFFVPTGKPIFEQKT